MTRSFPVRRPYCNIAAETDILLDCPSSLMLQGKRNTITPGTVGERRKYTELIPELYQGKSRKHFDRFLFYFKRFPKAFFLHQPFLYILLFRCSSQALTFSTAGSSALEETLYPYPIPFRCIFKCPPSTHPRYRSLIGEDLTFWAVE